MSLPYSKQVIAISQTSATNGETVTGNIDTKGFDFLSIDVITSTSNNVTNNPSVLKLSESDTTDVSTFANISGAVGDTDFTIPASVTSGNWGVKFNVDLVGRKRYLKVSSTPVTTQTFTVIGNLFKGVNSPSTSTVADVKALVNL